MCTHTHKLKLIYIYIYIKERGVRLCMFAVHVQLCVSPSALGPFSSHPLPHRSSRSSLRGRRSRNSLFLALAPSGPSSSFFTFLLARKEKSQLSSSRPPTLGPSPLILHLPPCEEGEVATPSLDPELSPWPPFLRTTLTPLDHPCPTLDPHFLHDRP